MSLCIQPMIPHRGGLPHSDTPGSKLARSSSGIFAACHVLHRLLVPRHPPDALLLLQQSNPPCTGPTSARRAAKHDHNTPRHQTPPKRARPLTQHIRITNAPEPCNNHHVGQPIPIPQNQGGSQQASTGQTNHVIAITDKPKPPTQTPQIQRPTTSSKTPSCPARPGAHQNLIHSCQRTNAHPAQPPKVPPNGSNPIRTAPNPISAYRAIFYDKSRPGTHRPKTQATRP